MPVLVAVHHRIIGDLVPGHFTGLPLHVRHVLHAHVRAAPSRFDLHLLRLGLLAHLAERLLHLTLHLILKVLYVLRHLSVLRHEVVLLRQLRQIIVLQLIRRLTGQLVLLLTKDRTCRVFRYVSHQSVQLGERLIARVTVIMILSFQFTERSAAALLRSVQRVRRCRTGGRKNR